MYKDIIENVTGGYDLSTVVNDLILSYDDIGVGAVPVIFLHGFPFNRTMWRSQLEFLGSSHRVISIDMRGFGESRDERSPLYIDLFADDLIKFMDKLGIDNAVVCGLSMGGYVALNAQKKYPRRFAGLILCDTQCSADTIKVKEKRYEAMDEIEAKGPNHFNEGFIKSVFHPDSLNNKKELVAQLGKMVFANTPRILMQGLIAIAERSETCSTLGSINIPTLIICGREDGLTPLAKSELMHKHITGSVLRVIENAGHVSNLEQPDEFNKHLSEFLKGIMVKRENIISFLLSTIRR